MSCRYVDEHVWLAAVAYFDGACAYCGSTRRPLTADHLLAKSRGGTDTPSNIVPACEECNQRKGTTDWREFMMSMPNFSQERMNKVFNWRRICRQARVGGEQ